jgi:hypothetical protein
MLIISLCSCTHCHRDTLFLFVLDFNFPLCFIVSFVVVLATCNALRHGVVVVLATRGVLIVLFMVFNYL